MTHSGSMFKEVGCCLYGSNGHSNAVHINFTDGSSVEIGVQPHFRLNLYFFADFAQSFSTSVEITHLYLKLGVLAITAYKV